MTAHFTTKLSGQDIIDLWRTAETVFREWLAESIDPTGYIMFARDSFRPIFQYVLLQKISMDVESMKFILNKIVARLELYLDTNVLVNLLTSYSGPFQASCEFFRIIKKLKIPIKIWHVTEGELSYAINVTIKDDVDRAVRSAKRRQFPSDLSPFAIEYLSENRWGTIEEYIRELNKRKSGVFETLGIQVETAPIVESNVVTSLIGYLANLEKSTLMQAQHDAICVVNTLNRSIDRTFTATDLEGKTHLINRPAIFVTCDSVLATQLRDRADVAVLCLELAYMFDEVVSILRHRDGLYRRMENQISNGFSNSDRTRQWMLSELMNRFFGGVILDA